MALRTRLIQMTVPVMLFAVVWTFSLLLYTKTQFVLKQHTDEIYRDLNVSAKALLRTRDLSNETPIKINQLIDNNGPELGRISMKTIPRTKQKIKIDTFPVHVWKLHPGMRIIDYTVYIEVNILYNQPERNVTKPTVRDGINSTWDVDNFSAKLNVSSSTCRRLVSFGGILSCGGSRDGHKYVCLDADVSLYPAATPRSSVRLDRKTKYKHSEINSAQKTPGCVVYSFGIGPDMTFDRTISRFGCKTFSFDMTLQNATNRVIQKNLNYINVGIDTEPHEMDMTMLPSKTRLRSSVRTMEEIMSVLDHGSSAVDYLKFDIEYDEWKILNNLMQSSEGREILRGVKQLAVEIHMDGLTNETESARIVFGQHYEMVLDGLYDLGFRLVHTFLNEFSQTYVDVLGRVIPIFRESLYVRRP